MPDNNFAKVWTKDRCVEALRHFGATHGYLSSGEYQKKVTFLCSGMKRGRRPFPNVEVIRQHFNSVDDAWRAAGIAVPTSEPVPEGMKRCGKCREVKATAEFSRNRATPDGLQCACKPCAKDQTNASAQRAKERKLAATNGRTVGDPAIAAVNARLDGAAGVTVAEARAAFDKAKSARPATNTGFTRLSRGIAFSMPEGGTSFDPMIKASRLELENNDLREKCDLLARMVKGLVNGELSPGELGALRAGLAVAGTLGG